MASNHSIKCQHHLLYSYPFHQSNFWNHINFYMTELDQVGFHQQSLKNINLQYK